MISEPPREPGASHESVTDSPPLVATTFCGAPGVVIGIPVAISEAILVPTEDIANTLNSYVSPFVNPIIVTLVSPANGGVVDGDQILSVAFLNSTL